MSNLKPFQPGQSGNPGGRPALPPEIREMRRKNQAYLIQLVTDLLGMTEAQAKERFNKDNVKEATQLETTVQSLIEIVKFGGKSAPQAFKLLMEIAAGTLPEDGAGTPAVQVNVQNNTQVVNPRSKEERDARIDELLAKMKQKP